MVSLPSQLFAYIMVSRRRMHAESTSGPWYVHPTSSRPPRNADSELRASKHGQRTTDRYGTRTDLGVGSGEAIRGNINNFVDGLGAQASSHSGGSGQHTGVGDNTSTNPGPGHSTHQTQTQIQHSTLSNPNPNTNPRTVYDNGGIGHAIGQGGASREVQKDIENRGVANQGKEEIQAGLNAVQKK